MTQSAGTIATRLGDVLGGPVHDEPPRRRLRPAAVTGCTPNFDETFELSAREPTLQLGTRSRKEH
jgi:hypothetical protein